MSEKLDIPNVMTPKFRVSFPAVFRPGKAVDPTKPPKYGITMLFDKNTDLSPLMNAMVDFMTKKFGPNKDTWPKLSRNPFRDQGEKTFEGYVAGAKFINASSNTKPGLVGPNNEDIINEAEFYPGCYARATVRPFWYDKAGNPVSGDKQFLKKPLLAGEVATIVLRTPKNPNSAALPPGIDASWISPSGPQALRASPERPCSRQNGRS